MGGDEIYYFNSLPQFIQYLVCFLFTVLHLVHVFRYFIFAPHFEQNASLSSTNTWHFGQRGTGWLSALTGIIVPHLEQCRVVLRGTKKTNGPNISANNMASPKPVRGSTTVSFLQVSQYARIFSPLCSALSWLDSAFNWFALGWGAQNQKTHVEVFISYCALFYFFLRYVEPRTLTVRIPPVLLLTKVLVLARLLTVENPIFYSLLFNK